jgi:methionyl-tRNA formyltransferase
VLADGTVATGDGCLRVLELQPAGKRLMTWKDFVNGHRVVAGDRFCTPNTETPTP